MCPLVLGSRRGCRAPAFPFDPFSKIHFSANAVRVNEPARAELSCDAQADVTKQAREFLYPPPTGNEEWDARTFVKFITTGHETIYHLPFRHVQGGNSLHDGEQALCTPCTNCKDFKRQSMYCERWQTEALIYQGLFRKERRYLRFRKAFVHNWVQRQV